MSTLARIHTWWVAHMLHASQPAELANWPPSHPASRTQPPSHPATSSANQFASDMTSQKSPAICAHHASDLAAPALFFATSMLQWQDERGHWHMLMHNMGQKPPLLNRAPGDDGERFVSHAFSRDSINWTRSMTAPVTSKVTFTDGSVKYMLRRERPQLLLSPRGQPRYYSSGVEDVADHTYTLVVKVNS